MSRPAYSAAAPCCPFCSPRQSHIAPAAPSSEFVPAALFLEMTWDFWVRQTRPAKNALGGKKNPSHANLLASKTPAKPVQDCQLVHGCRLQHVRLFSSFLENLHKATNLDGNLLLGHFQIRKGCSNLPGLSLVSNVTTSAWAKTTRSFEKARNASKRSLGNWITSSTFRQRGRRWLGRGRHRRRCVRLPIIVTRFRRLCQRRYWHAFRRRHVAAFRP